MDMKTHPNFSATVMLANLQRAFNSSNSLGGMEKSFGK